MTAGRRETSRGSDQAGWRASHRFLAGGLARLHPGADNRPGPAQLAARTANHPLDDPFLPVHGSAAMLRRAAPQKMKMGRAAAGAKRLGLRQSPGPFARALVGKAAEDCRSPKRSAHMHPTVIFWSAAMCSQARPLQTMKMERGRAELLLRRFLGGAAAPPYRRWAFSDQPPAAPRGAPNDEDGARQGAHSRARRRKQAERHGGGAPGTARPTPLCSICQNHSSSRGFLNEEPTNSRRALLLVSSFPSS